MFNLNKKKIYFYKKNILYIFLNNNYTRKNHKYRFIMENIIIL